MYGHPLWRMPFLFSQAPARIVLQCLQQIYLSLFSP
jgi:hypothetical protein